MVTTETFDLPFLQLSFRKDLGILFTRWGQYVGLNEYIEGYTRSLQVARETDAHFWLVDLRMRNTPDNELHNWYENTFVPTVLDSLKGKIYLAYLISPLQLDRIPNSEHQTNIATYNDCLIIKCFTKEKDALQWLGNCK